MHVKPTEPRTSPSAALMAAIERSRKRVWGLCYRMTGSRDDADDLAQEALARAIEREDEIHDRDRLDAWLLRIATNVCLDHARRQKVRRRVTDLVDAVDAVSIGVLPAASSPAAAQPESALLLREDVRFAVVVALQHLPARQRATLLLHDVCDHPITDVAQALGIDANAAKSLLHRARARLARLRERTDVDLSADPAVVERLAAAIGSRSIAAFTALLDEEVWGILDGGGVVHTPSKPIRGARAVSRVFANANRRQALAVAAGVRVLNGEPAVVVTVPEVGHFAVACFHVETRGGRIAAMRVVRDPRKLMRLPAAAPAAARL